jgi:hypothetical protein
MGHLNVMKAESVLDIIQVVAVQHRIGLGHQSTHKALGIESAEIISGGYILKKLLKKNVPD